MKKLTRMKLINWHRFENCYVEFDSSTLISGENGAGKSTLLDAIQFVILCSAASFNKAAHDNGKRKLTGYIRCKSGKENRPYERTGEISAHVALEFYEESRDRYFIIGAVVDSASEGQEATARYLIDNARLSDSMFFKGSSPRSVSEFRTANKNIRQWCKTQAEARRMVSSRLGRIQDKFFRLIPKALAFKPIDDIKDFVYSYVLDEKEVNIDGLRENVRTYQDLEKTLESVKNRISKLEQIESHHSDVLSCERRDRMYEYFLARAGEDITREEIERLGSRLRSDKYQLEMALQNKDRLVSEREGIEEIVTALRAELMHNEDYIAQNELKKQLEHYKEEENICREELKRLKINIRHAMAQVERLRDIQGADSCIEEYRRLFSDPDNIKDVAGAKDLVDRVIAYKKRTYEKTRLKTAREQVKLDDKKGEAAKLKKRISDLERKKLAYPEGVERLITSIREEFARLDLKSEPHVLCELLDISDESWRNAVEGYLNTQRFYILVEPESFDIALGIYDRLRRQGRVYGAGLINVHGMEAYDTAPEGTLAECVATRNRYARRYVNMVLGRVQMCGRFEDLRKYPISITRECMRYQNRVASAIKPEIFSVPFIGRNAFKVQLELARKQAGRLDEEIKEIAAGIRSLDNLIEPLSTEAEIEIRYGLDVLVRLEELSSAIGRCRASISRFEKNTTLIHKQIELDKQEGLRRDKDKEIDKCSQDIGRLQGMLDMAEEQLGRLGEELEEKQRTAGQLAEAAGDGLDEWNKEYIRQTRDKSLSQFRDNYERQRKANETSRQKALALMTEWMLRYKTEHDFGAAANMEGFAEFAAVHDRLRNSELLEYEGKVQAAREAAEEEFREQFLARLQENMKQAQSEFRELNRALKDITFSSDRYEFLYMPSRLNRSYYEMIMDDFNILQGVSIFSGVFHEEHKAVIEELFDRLALNGENNEKVLDEYTDYRTYMDYDIKIIHDDGSYSYYSKVCEEKSGGETQTPFYVTVAASFVQLYNNNIGGEAAGIVMFDEAFNNMDDERIGGVLEFMNRLPLQMIISAPPEKIQYIAPSMSETLLIMTDGKVSYVEEYHRSGHQEKAG